MTPPFHRRRPTLERRRLLLAAAGWVLAGGLPNQALGKNKMTSTQHMTLWELLDQLAQQAPFSREKIEKLLGTRLVETSNASNDFFQFYKLPSPLALEGAALDDIDLRIKSAGGHPGFLVLQLAASKLTLAEVRRHYPELRITDAPRGRSPDEVTSHSAFLPWGKLSFSFPVRQPDCVSRIALDPAPLK